MPRMPYLAAAYCGARALPRTITVEADVDDRAVGLLQHAGAELVDAEHGALDVHGEDVVDGLLGEVAPGHLIARHVADVVDQYVQPAEAVEDLVGHADDVGLDGDVDPHGERLTTDVLDAGNRLVGSGSGAAVGTATRAPSWAARTAISAP